MKPVRGDIAEAVVSEAAGWLGTPYRHQASRKGVGCDCLGLVRGVWRALYGEEPEAPGPYSMDWAEAGGRDRLLEAASRHFIPARMPGRGRLILFRWRPHLPAKHAAICIGAERFIHAHEGHGVVESALVPQWRKRIAGVFDFPENPED